MSCKINIHKNKRIKINNEPNSYKLDKKQRVIALSILVIIILIFIGILYSNHYKISNSDIVIYKDKKYNGDNSYFNKKRKNNKVVGAVNCKNKNCKYIKAYDKYLVTQEDNNLYIYDYKKNKLVFGPVKIIQGVDTEGNNILSYKNTLYGIFYEENGQYNIYNLKNNFIIKNIDGMPSEDQFEFNPSIVYKHGYFPITNIERTDFINIENGNLEYSLNYIDRFYEDEKNNILYTISYENSDYDKLLIYDIRGNLLLNENKFDCVNVVDGNIIVGEQNSFKIYDYKFNLKFSSKLYDDILYIYKDFILVFKNNHLQIIDMDDNTLAEFKDNWDNQNYIINFLDSGWDTKNGKYGIYIRVRDEMMEEKYGREYYYIPETGELGFNIID